MREAQGKISIVGQQKQAAGVAVQAAHGVNAQAARLGRQQVKHGRPALRVTRRSDVSLWLMQEYIDVPGRGAYRFSIDIHFIMLGINVDTLRGHGKAIDLHATGGNQFFRVAS
jgi:hypothetical protein